MFFCLQDFRSGSVIVDVIQLNLMTSLGYEKEKFSSAVVILATTADYHDAMRLAFIEIIPAISSNDNYPPNLPNIATKIRDGLSHKGELSWTNPSGQETARMGAYNNTNRDMTEATYEKFVKLIVQMDGLLESS